MSHVEHLTDRVEALQLDRRKNREQKRHERIFNDRVRTSGVDRDALDYQVKERREKEQREADERQANESHTGDEANDLICGDRAACVLDQRQKKDERFLNEAIVQFRDQFQQASSRREFDLNDPELLKKQEGMKILPGLTGEDLSRKEREKKQKEQLRGWCIQQQQEREQTKQQLEQELHQYDQSRLSLDNRALELENMEKQFKRATTTATKDFNLSLAAESAQRRFQERREEEENNRTDIMNQLNGDLLTENPQQSASVLGPSRLRRDCYKGMSPKELQQYTLGQQQQAEEKRRVCMEQKEKEMQEYNLRMASAHAALLLERQQARANKELRRALDNTNAQLAQTHNAQQKHLQKVYTNILDESYFSQFNSSNR